MTAKDNTTPHYFCRATEENYCQYCMEGIAEREPEEYLLLPMPRGCCVNCEGRCTPAEKNYYIVEACTESARADANGAHAALHGYIGALAGNRLDARHSSAQTITVYDTEHGVALDTFSLTEWREVLAAGTREKHGLRINW